MAGVGICGKHPGFGDFLSAGLSEVALNGLTTWLDQVLPEIRDAVGADWEAVYDHAPQLRFWVGPEVLGTPLCGVMQPSRDKVGRRYPLILAEEGGDALPPVLDPAQARYTRLAQHLAEAQPVLGEGARGLLSGLSPPDEGGEIESAFWAANPKSELSDLFGDVSTADHLRAAGRRSYWWTPGDGHRASALHAGPGLPEAPAMLWLIRGMAVQSETEGAPEHADEQ